MKQSVQVLLRCGLFISLIWSSIFAQTAIQDTTVLTIDHAQEIALQKNPQLQSAQKDVEKAHSQVLQARGNLMPSLNAYTNYNHNFELPVISVELPNLLDPTAPPVRRNLVMGSKENITAGVQAQIPLFLGLRINSGYHIAKEGETIASNQYTITKQQILLQVRQAFYNALFTQELISVAEEALRNAQQNLDQVQKRKDVGTASGFDLLRAKVQVANTRPQVIAAQHRFDQALTGLRTAIGLNKDMPITVTGKLNYEESSLADSSLKSLQAYAFKHRLELKDVHKQRQIQQKNLTIARAKYLPTLSASANLQHQMQQNNLDVTRKDFVRSISGGLTLSIPLFAGGSNYAGVQQARVNLRQVDDTEQQVKNMIAAQVESAYYSLIDAKQKIESQSQTIDQAEESVRLAELMYREGTTTQLDVLNAQLALQQARSNYSQYLLQYNVAQDQLHKAINDFGFQN